MNQYQEYRELVGKALEPQPPHPYMTLFREQFGRYPTKEELSAFIDIYVLPDVAVFVSNGTIQEDREKTQKIRELQKLKLIEMVKKNDRFAKNGI